MRTMIGLCTILFAVLTACNVNYEKTKSGLQYKLYKGKNTTLVKAGQFVKLNMEYRTKIKGKDTILSTTYGKMPAFTPVDTSERSAYSFFEILPKMAAGDSAEFVMSVDSLKKRNLIPSFDTTFKAGSTITGRLKLVEIYATEDQVKAAYDKEVAAMKEVELKAVETYLAKNNIKAMKTANGVYIKVDSYGDTSFKATPGRSASVMYKGRLMSNGRVFDTNMDNSKGHTDPLTFQVGTQGIIPAWNEAFPYFGKGGKGTIYIPSAMAYGPQAMGADIPPNSNLIFDVQVVDVKAAPPQPAAPAMPKP